MTNHLQNLKFYKRSSKIINDKLDFSHEKLYSRFRYFNFFKRRLLSLDIHRFTKTVNFDTSGIIPIFHKFLYISWRYTIRKKVRKYMELLLRTGFLSHDLVFFKMKLLLWH